MSNKNEESESIVESESTDVGKDVIPCISSSTASQFSDFVDRNYPMTMLPEEILEMIVNQIGDSKSILNLFLAYPMLRDTFNKKIPLWFFGEVFAHLLPYLRMKDIRRCTHVCKTWRQAIFKFTEDHPSRRPYNKELTSSKEGPPSPVVQRFLELSFENFGTTESIVKFLEINPSHMNPFIGRSVSLAWSGGSDFGIFKTYCTMLLQQYGKHILYFRICDGPDSAEDFYNRLKVTLSMTPNLRSLHVKSATDTAEETVDPTSPLPLLTNLESLRLEWLRKYQSENVFASLIINYAKKNLGFLSMSLASWSDKVIQHYNKRPDDTTLLELTELHILNCEGREDSRCFVHLMNRVGFDKLVFRGVLGRSRYEFFRKLRGEPVVELDMDCSPYFNEGKCNSNCEDSGYCSTDRHSIELTKLQVLRIKFDPRDSYKFIKQIPSLQHLVIKAEINYTTTLDEWMLGQQSKLATNACASKNGCYYDEFTKEVQQWIYQDPSRDMARIWNVLTGLQTIKIMFQYQQQLTGNDGVCRNFARSRNYIFRRREFVQLTSKLNPASCS